MFLKINKQVGKAFKIVSKYYLNDLTGRLKS